MSIICICYAAKNAQFSSGRVDENKRAAKSLESFHCKTSFRLKEKRGREGEHLSLGDGGGGEERETRRRRRRRTRPETAFGSSESGGRRRRRRREENWSRRCPRSGGRKRERDRSEETEKGGTATTNTRASERTERKGEMKCNGRTGYRKLKLNQEIPSNVPHPFQRTQGTYKIDTDASNLQN